MALLLYRVGRAAVRQRRRVLAAWVAAAVAIVALGATVGAPAEGDFDIPGVDSQAAYDLLEDRFPSFNGATAQIVFHTDDGTVRDPASAAVVAATLDAVRAQPHVTGIVDPLTGPGLVAADGATAMAVVRYDAPIEAVGEQAYERLVAATEDATAAGVQAELGGELPRIANSPETGAAELVGIGAAVVVLLFAFGSVIAMGLPIGLALFGIVTSLAGIMVLTRFVPMPAEGPMLATMIGLGVGIDYALFVVTRHRQHLARGMTVEESAGRANATAGQAVVFAGGTVVIAILGLVLTGVPPVARMGMAASLTVGFMVLATVTLLPALLGFAGASIDRLRIPFSKAGRAEVAEAAGTGRWYRWGNHVARHPWPWLVASLVVLVGLTAPLTAIRLGSPDPGTLPESDTQRRAFDLIEDEFGPGFNGFLVVAADLDGAADPAAVDRLAVAIGADAGVLVSLPAERSPGDDAAVISVVPTTGPSDEATSALVHRIRDEVIPNAVDGSGVTAHVGGLTASIIDVDGRVAERLPWFVGAVVVLSFLLLLVVFRSILVPLKAALMNLLSIGAAYGVIVAVFQWGWGASLIGVEETLPIVSFVPMFMFAILFGLSMDYEVFLLSRVREAHLAGRSNTESVIEGISSTARVITSAALIMMSVFGGFVFADHPVMKMFGLGLATAVFVDATVVRVVLVPATMRLMGAANWWFPAWLDRILPNIDIEGEGALPDPEYRWSGHPVTSAERDRDPIAA